MLEDHQARFISHRDALRLFSATGLSEATFTRKVAEGKIERRLPDGRQRGSLYREDQILEIVQKHLEKKQKKQKKRGTRSLVQFRRMNLEDMPIVADILHELFDGYPNIPQWQERMKANPDIGYVVTDDGIIKGCGFTMPHTEEKILSIFPLEETPITHPHEILSYEPGAKVCLYLRSVGVRQKGVPAEKKKVWAQVLIIGLLKEMVKLGSRGIIIEKIYARSDTFQGERMLHRLGFTRLTTTTSHENFVIDVAPSGLTFMKQYKMALARWRTKYEGA